MSDGGGWIVIPNWPMYQHYADRTPPWIKDHLSQLHHDTWLDTPFQLRGLLEGLRLLYAATDGRVQFDTSRLSRSLGQRVLKSHIEALNHAGFIELSASKPLALSRARARALEREEESREEKQGRASAQNENQRTSNGELEPASTAVNEEMIQLARSTMRRWDSERRDPPREPEWIPSEEEPF